MTKLTIRDLLKKAENATDYEPDGLAVAELAERVEAVLKLHHPGPYFQPDERMDAPGRCCVICKGNWPCPTIRALNGEQEVKPHALDLLGEKHDSCG